MLPDLISRSLRVAIIKAILTVSQDTALAYVIVTSALVMWHPAISLVFCLESSMLTSNTIWHHTSWLPIGTDFPSRKMSNATLTFSISFGIASAHKVLSFLAFRTKVFSTVLGSSMTNLLPFLKYLVCFLLMQAIILSLFLSTCLTSRLMINPLCNSKLSCLHRIGFFELDNFSHEVELSFHWQQLCHSAVVLQVTGLFHVLICCSVREIMLFFL